MTKNRRYYWLKLGEDFFNRAHMRFLRAEPQGDRLCLLYLKMLLLAMNHGGAIPLEGLGDSPERELACWLGEEGDVDAVRAAMDALIRLRRLFPEEDGTLRFPEVEDMVGSETESAERMRTVRTKKRESATGAQWARSDAHCAVDDAQCAPETEKDPEKDTYTEKEPPPQAAGAGSGAKEGFIPPTREEVAAYIQENGGTVDPDRFLAYNASVGWRRGNTPVQDWQALLRTWMQNERQGAAKDASSGASSFETDEFLAAALARSYKKEE